MLGVYPGAEEREGEGLALRPQASPSPSWTSVFLSTVSISEVPDARGGLYSFHVTATLSGPALLSAFCTGGAGSLDSPKDP